MADVPGDDIDGGLVIGTEGGRRWANRGGEFVGLGALPAPPDATPPVVGNFSPASGSTVEATDPIFFDVTDDSGEFRRVLVAVDQAGTTELAHDGDNFMPPYATLSTRTNIAGGFRFRLRRDSGWVNDVTPRIFAIDPSGNEN